MTWTLLHSTWLHILLAALNAHDYTMRYVTTFTTEIFSLLNSVIYVHKAIQELQRAHSSLSLAAFLYAIIGATGALLLAVLLSSAEKWAPLFGRYFRLGLAEYAAAISIIIFIGLPHAGELATLDKLQLPVSTSFTPSSPDRTTFFVQFWHLPLPWVFAALVPGMIITILFFFDHEVSSIICTSGRYVVEKKGGFAWDVVLLGVTTGMCGVLGVPPANGLLPQAPLHAESLLHVEAEDEGIGKETGIAAASEETRVDAVDFAKVVRDNDDLEVQARRRADDRSLGHLDRTETVGMRGGEKIDQPAKKFASPKITGEKPVPCPTVYEQRWSHLLHAIGILAFVSPPLMHVLGLTPTSVLAGLFLFMAEQSLSVKYVIFLSSPNQE